MAAVRDVVRGLAGDGYERFHASFVASQANESIPAVRAELAQLVASGTLTESYEVVCPNCGRTLAVYASQEALPVGDRLECHSCDIASFVVSLANVWITYTPTTELLLTVNRERRGQGDSKKARVRRMTPLPRLRTILRRLTGWAKIST